MISNKTIFRRITLVTGVLILFMVGLGWRSEKTTSSQHAANAAPKVAVANARPQHPRKQHNASPLSRVDSEGIWDFDLEGQSLSITLALNEVALRDEDGKDHITPLNPPATEETLAAKLAELSAPKGVFPVAYRRGEPRSGESRRIVTPDLRVKMDAGTAARVAAAHHLVIKDIPSYAPGWVIMSAATPLAALDAMVNLRAVAEVASADVLLAVQHTLKALPNDPLVTSQWHLKKTSASTAGTDVNIESAWNYPNATGIRGAGIHIGIVDDGLQTAHPDLAANVNTADDKDWNGGDADPNPGTGDDHGTACAGNAAAKGNNALGVSGTAPDAKLIGMRLIAGSVTDTQEAEAMTYTPQSPSTTIVEILSNSWGPADDGFTLEGPGPLTTAALQTATTSGRGGKGSIILWAGGNGGDVSDNSNYDGYANSIYTIAIGATDSTGQRSYYSEPGANVVVCAPSNGGPLGITTVDRTGTAGYNTSTSANGGDYTDDFGGTSSATPTAAGIVALILEKNPNLGWRDVQEILIRSAVHPPGSTGWVTNGGGISFNHNFGAGLIHATAAVNLAATWTNLAAQTSSTSTQSGLSVAIPNNNSAGITRTFDLSASSVRVEQVTLKLSATHSARENLEITLTSPSGMVSNLAETHNPNQENPGVNYSNWTFSSVRHWGESSTGTWTLKVADRSSTVNTSGGTLTAVELKVFGTATAAVNPPPVVQITQPANGQAFSPGATVNVWVTATDLTASASTGVVSQVQLLDNNVVVGTLTSAPYNFTLSSPALGSHMLVAKATDSESAVGTSASVNFTVANQAPTISAATLSASGQSYSDTPLAVSSVTASDPEGTPLIYNYQWQASSNGTVFTDVSGETSSTAPALAGNLLRCVVTASDGSASSEPFTTAAVNLLTRPGTTAATGSNYSHTSGLVLRGSESPLSRQAIINEFSQGPSGSSSEWIEILTLKAGSLAFWDLHDAADNLLVFLDDPVWDNIPAGTVIVVYNGASKDALLPADDLDPSDGRMVVSSTNPDYFDDTYDSWLPLGNSGDSIFLADADEAVVHSIAYGNSTATTPNVGNVGSSKSAYYSADTDAGADVAANWRVTTSLTSRSLKNTRAAGDLFMSEYVEGSANNKALEIYNPSGSAVDLAATGYKVEIYANGAAAATSNVSLTGTLAANSTYVIKHSSASATITAQLTSINLSFNGNDAVVLKKGSTTVDSFGLVGVDPGAEWAANGVTTKDKTLRRKPSILQGDTNPTNAFDPSEEWDVFAIDTFTGLGSHTVNSPTPAITLTINPTTFAENLGASAATGTVSIPAPLGAPLVVSLASSDTGEATAPATATIAAGQTSSPTFAITAVDDSDSDGPQQVILTAAASGYTNGFSTLTVTDNEASVEGVTPAAGNNVANLAFVSALRNGSLNSPALFRIGVGSTIPTGLTLDANTGILSGTISNSNPAGDYPIVIERYNGLGETVSQSFTLTLTAAANDYAAWIGQFAVGDQIGLNDDFDKDGLPNGIENILGSHPTVYNAGLVNLSKSGNTLVFRHSRSNTIASDLTATYEWTSNLADWQASEVEANGVTVKFVPAVITDVAAPANDLVEVTATITGSPASQVFVRVKAVK